LVNGNEGYEYIRQAYGRILLTQRMGHVEPKEQQERNKRVRVVEGPKKILWVWRKRELV